MSHATIEQIHGIIDRTLGEPERERLMVHITSCQKCSGVLALEQSIVKAIRNAPLVKPSGQFTAKVMERILPGNSGSLLFRALSAGGKTLAMIAVLAVVGYVLTLNVPGDEGKGRTESSQFMKTFSQYYQEASRFISAQSKQMSRGMVETTAAKQWEIIGMIVMTFVILLLIDRHVVRPLMKLKL